MRFTMHQNGLVAVATLSGRFDAYTVPAINSWLDAVTAAPPARVVLDLKDVTFADSTGLAALVRGMKRAREHKGDLRLCGLQKPVRTILELTRLDRVIDIRADEPAAVQSFGN
jgi:anti-sigma B factor antagonist